MPCAMAIDSPVGRLTVSATEDADRRDRLGRTTRMASRSPLLVEAAAPARRLFRTARLSHFDLPLMPGGLGVRAAGVGGDAADPAWRDPQLRRAGDGGRLGAARGRPRLRAKSDPDRDPVPSGAGARRSSAATAAARASRPSTRCSHLKARRRHCCRCEGGEAIPADQIPARDRDFRVAALLAMTMGRCRRSSARDRYARLTVAIVARL